MHDKINKIIYIVLILLVSIFLFIIFYNKFFSIKEYTVNFDTLGKQAIVKLYNIDKTRASKHLKEIKKIFDEYTNLTDNRKEIGHNLYYIKNNNSNLEYIDIDKRLYDLIKYGLDWYDKSDGLIDISSGDIVDAFNGLVSDKDILASKKVDINDIVLKDNRIKNNHININLEDVKIGYVIDLVAEYLEDNLIKNYYIYVDGTVRVGKHYSNKFGIGLESPSNHDIYEVVYGNNISVSTVNYDKSMINLNTYEEAIEVYGLSIIGRNASDTYVISRLCFVNKLEDSKNYINKLDGLEGIWYKFSNDIVKSSGFDKYKKK